MSATPATGNLAPYNVLIVLPDVLIPLTTLVLLAWYFRSTATEKDH